MSVTASWYHCSVKPISRSNGRTAVAAAAYRSGGILRDDQLEKTYDYTRKRGIEVSFIVAPENAPNWAYNLERLWNEAQAKDNRVNSRMAREVELALPDALDAADREELVRDFSLHLVERYGVAVSAALHEPSRYGDDRNYHAHILFTTRRIDEDGFGEKTRELDGLKSGPLEVEHLRDYASTLINSYLEEAGSDERVDHRSFEDRGLPYEPMSHMGVEASAMERRGEESRIGTENHEIREHNRQIDAMLYELADIDTQIAANLEVEFLPEEPAMLSLEGAVQVTPAQEEQKSAVEGKVPQTEPGLEQRAGQDAPQEKEQAANAWAAATAAVDSLFLGDPAKASQEHHESQAQASQDVFTCQVAKDYEKMLFGDTPVDWERERAEQREGEHHQDVFTCPAALAYEQLIFGKPVQPPERQAEQEETDRPQEHDQDVFNSPIAQAYERDIMKRGAIREYGFGRFFYARTITAFEDLYYGTIANVKTLVQKYFVKGQPDIEGPDDLDHDR